MPPFFLLGQWFDSQGGGTCVYLIVQVWCAPFVKAPEIDLPSHRHFLHLYVAASCEWLRGVFSTFPNLYARIITDQRSYLNRDLRFDQKHWSQLLCNNASLQNSVLFYLATQRVSESNVTGSSKPCSPKNWCQQDSSELGATFAGLGRPTPCDRPNAKINDLLNSGGSNSC